MRPIEEAEPVLEPERVRDGSDERPARPQNPAHLRGEAQRIAQVLEQLAGDDDVEPLVLEGQRLVEVGPVGLDAELRGLGERVTVGVDADDLVPVGVGLRQRAIAAAEVEHAPAGPTDVTPEQVDALLSRDRRTRRRARPGCAACIAR